MSETPVEAAPASPRASAILMNLTYVVGAIGVFIGFTTVNRDPASLTWACLLAVGGGGILSFVRHSIFHRSDAARMHWDLGRRNNFQIEVGLANLAWGLLGVAAVVFQWGLVAESSAFLVFGFYLTAVAVMLVTDRSAGKARPWAAVIGMAVFGIMLIALGWAGMQAA